MNNKDRYDLKYEDGVLFLILKEQSNKFRFTEEQWQRIFKLTRDYMKCLEDCKQKIT